MTKPKKLRQVKSVWLTIGGLIGLGLLIALLIRGTNIAVFNPKGQIAQQQFALTTFSVLLMLAIAIPTLIVLYAFAWQYRESNEKATYDPNTRHGKFFVLGMWAVPSVFALVLAGVMWPATHKLEPQKTIASDTKPLTIQVVAMRWKWLFIYPEQNIATVNYVQIPTDTPVQFDLTADETPMSSFWIPNLGGQLYAMTGHVNRLNLMAEHPGDYPGSSAEINGAGFAGMKFIARASSAEDFDQWVQDMQVSPSRIDDSEYKNLLKPSENNKPVFYSSVDTSLYADILTKYMGSHDHEPTNYEAGH